MKDKNDWVKEEELLESQIQTELDNLDKKWFKTTFTDEMIKFLNHYLEMKQQFIEKLKTKKEK